MRTRLALLATLTMALLVACPSRTTNNVLNDNTNPPNTTPIDTPAIVVEPVQDPIENPKGISILSLTDVNGNLFHMEREVNVSKTVDLIAAQYEDAMCLRVRVRDGNQNNVANALVKVQAASLRDVSISPGCVSGSLGAANFEQVRTNASGEALFTIFAPTPEVLLEVGSNLLREPIKYVVTAVSNDMTTAAEPLEFKVFYLNMSHLWFGDITTVEMNRQPPVVFKPEQQTERRWGQDFGTILNIFRGGGPCTGGDCTNTERFGTWAFTKQPQFPANALALPQPLLFPGYMRYELSAGAKAIFAPDYGCEQILDNGLVCIDREADGPIAIRPNPAATVQDLPIAATVRAIFMAEFQYGLETYEFPLKMYRFTKRWVGSFATIEKSVDNHVLTWAGPDFFKSANSPEAENLKTLAATNQTNVVKASQDVFTTTVHLTVKNSGSEPIHHLTIRDAVPAELGVIADANGLIVDANSGLTGTYDPINHVVTFNWQRTGNNALTSLAAGMTQHVAFKVYARQKPGYCWNGAPTAAYNVPPRAAVMTPFTDCAYADPYRVVNGRLPNDVTVSYYMSDNFDETTVIGMENLSNQQIRDFTPVNANADIWVVRPLYDLAKQIIAPISNDVWVGQHVDFRITAKQEDRWTSGAYSNLRVLYPNEFPGGSGRLNPYGIGFRLEDRFNNELDYTNATDFVVAPGLGPDNSYEPQWTSATSKMVSWNIPGYQVFAANDVGTTRLTLNANSATLEYINDTIQTLAIIIQPTHPIECVEGGSVAWNCAFFNADNLNQQTDDRHSYGVIPWDQYEGVYYHGAGRSNSDVLNNNLGLKPTEVGTWTADTWLISCEFVTIYEQEEDIVVGLTARNESKNGDPAVLSDAGDPYPLNQEFFYRYDVNTRTSGAVNRLIFEVNLGGSDVVQYRTALAVKVYKSVDDGQTFTDITASIPIAAYTSTKVLTGEFTLPGETLFRIVIPAKGVGRGDVDMILATLTEMETGIVHTADDATVIF